jgi:hypothetical protein
MRLAEERSAIRTDHGLWWMGGESGDIQHAFVARIVVDVVGHAENGVGLFVLVVSESREEEQAGWAGGYTQWYPRPRLTQSPTLATHPGQANDKH